MFILDSVLSLSDHVNNVSRSCIYYLRQLLSIRQTLPLHTITILVHALICARVDYGNVISPVIARMCKASFEQCTLPVKQKMAVTRPLLKKPSMDPADPNSYRPISNLNFISKMIERMVDSRLIAYTDRYALTPIYQSAYRRNHSTETALVRIYNN